jgi:hypothetical protein
MKARSSTIMAADGRRIVIRWGTGYAPTVSEYTGKRHAREWNVPGGLATARALAAKITAVHI